MEHRIRAAGIFVQNDQILLVLHRDPENGNEWWIPPGGGMNAIDKSIFDTANREIFEETGLAAFVNRIAYIREFREMSKNVHHIEFFMPVEQFSGQLSIKNVLPDDVDALYIKDVKWINRSDLSEIVVYPEWLRGEKFWNDAKQKFPGIKYTESQLG